MIKREELTNPSSCMSRANDDEMTFVLLGRDAAAPVAIRAWIEERIRIGKNDSNDAQIIEAEACLKLMLGGKPFPEAFNYALIAYRLNEIQQHCREVRESCARIIGNMEAGR